MQRKSGFHLTLWLVLWPCFFITSSLVKPINDRYRLGEIAIEAVNGFLLHDIALLYACN